MENQLCIPRSLASPRKTVKNEYNFKVSLQLVIPSIKNKIGTCLFVIIVSCSTILSRVKSTEVTGLGRE